MSIALLGAHSTTCRGKHCITWWHAHAFLEHVCPNLKSISPTYTYFSQQNLRRTLGGSRKLFPMKTLVQGFGVNLAGVIEVVHLAFLGRANDLGKKFPERRRDINRGGRRSWTRVYRRALFESQSLSSVSTLVHGSSLCETHFLCCALPKSGSLLQLSWAATSLLPSRSSLPLSSPCHPENNNPPQFYDAEIRKRHSCALASPRHRQELPLLSLPLPLFSLSLPLSEEGKKERERKREREGRLKKNGTKRPPPSFWERSP